MKEMFKKSFGLILGVYTGCIAVNAFSEILKRLGLSNSDKTESDCEKES